MICKVCGHEDSENFSVCPFCGEATSSQTQSSQTNSQSSSSRPVARHYPPNMQNNFRGFGCSFESNQNELIMSRRLKCGDFDLLKKTFLPFVSFIIIFLFIGVIFLHLSVFSDFGGTPVFFDFLPSDILSSKKLFSDVLPFFIFTFVALLIIGSIVLPYAKIRVNSDGIIIKTLLKRFFIPKIKIDSIVCKTVTITSTRSGRYRGRRIVREDFYDVFIIMKDRSVCDKIELNTGLCYKNKIHIDYLIDEFNKHLGFL